MERQPFCSLPWCGKTGKIDGHHVIPRSQGGSDDESNIVYICHPCHMRHHSEGHITFEKRNGEWYALNPSGRYQALVVYDEQRDEVPFDTEDILGDLGEQLRELKCSGDQVDYFLSRELAEAEARLHGDRKQLAEWCVDNLDISPRSVDSYLSKRIAYASLPDECSTLGITNGYKVFLLSQAHPLDEVLSDYGSMSRSQFNEKYGLTKHKTKCECPVCGAMHTEKGES